MESASMLRASRSLPELALSSLHSAPRLSTFPSASRLGKLPRLGEPNLPGGETLRVSLQARLSPLFTPC